ncbi:MAG: TonB-dependent receptor [Sphingomonadales bacterium]
MTDLHPFIRLSGTASTLAIALALATPALAQQASPAAGGAAPASKPVSTNAATDAPEAPQTGDIIVTAQKRSERLQDVPLAVTAVTGDALANRQVSDTSTLTQAIPSLTFQQGPNATNTTLRIRGVGTALFGQGVESSVSVVIDGVVLARQAQGFADLADIERVEVLRGPQGTLFGKNASAGVISIVTARPSRDFEGRVESTIAEQGEYRAKGTISGPLSDTLRARLTGFYNDVPGITYNTTLGRRVNGQKSWGVRGKLEWEATDNLNLLLSAEYRKTNTDCCISSSIRVDNPVVAQLEAPVVASPTNRLVSEDTLTYADSDQKTFSLQADWDLGFATLTSITAYQDYYLKVNQPIDRINSDPVRFVGTGAAYASWNFNQGILDLSQFSQELRLGSKGNRDLTYVAGIFYSNADIKRPFSRRRALCATGVIGQVCAAPTYQSSSSFAELKTNSIAAFGQAEYRIVGGLKLLGGLRVQYEDGTNYGVQLGTVVAGDTLLPGVPTGSGTLSDHDTAVTGKVGLQYEFSRNLQTYATYTRGYKGLGYNMEAATNFTTQSTLRPENVNAYELGLKGRTSDGTLSMAVAVFRSEYTNLQVQANRSDPISGVTSFVATNAGTSRSQGVEVEATLRASRNFTVDASFTYTDSTVNIDGLNCPLQLQAAAPVMTGTPVNMCYRTAAGATPQQNLRDSTLPASPQIRISVAPRWEQEISNTLASFIQVGVNFQGKQQFAIEQDPLLVQEAYTLVDATIGLRTIDKRYTMSLFVKNLFDVNYYTSVSHNSLLATAARPFDLTATYNKDADRYFGATFGVRF